MEIALSLLLFIKYNCPYQSIEDDLEQSTYNMTAVVFPLSKQLSTFVISFITPIQHKDCIHLDETSLRSELESI